MFLGTGGLAQCCRSSVKKGRRFDVFQFSCAPQEMNCGDPYFAGRLLVSSSVMQHIWFQWMELFTRNWCSPNEVANTLFRIEPMRNDIPTDDGLDEM